MTELDNVSLYLYSMSSKGITFKKNLISILGRSLFKNSQKRYFIKYEKDSSKILILENVNALINKGDRIGLIGGNGAGKVRTKINQWNLPNPQRDKLRGFIFPNDLRNLNISHDLSGLEAVKGYYYQHQLKSYGIRLNDFISEIEESCQIGKYFYEPICYFSEGMRTRLTFSLLTSVDYLKILL